MDCPFSNYLQRRRSLFQRILGKIKQAKVKAEVKVKRRGLRVYRHAKVHCTHVHRKTQTIALDAQVRTCRGVQEGSGRGHLHRRSACVPLDLLPDSRDERHQLIHLGSTPFRPYKRVVDTQAHINAMLRTGPRRMPQHLLRLEEGKGKGGRRESGKGRRGEEEKEEGVRREERMFRARTRARRRAIPVPAAHAG